MYDRFGRFLVSRGVLTPDTLLRALREQAALRPDPVITAVGLGLLSHAQALNLVDDMTDTGQSFDEAVLEGQFLTRPELARVNARRAETTPMLGQVLVSMGWLTPEALQAELGAFAQSRGPARRR